MEFLKKNFYETTTQIAVNSNTVTAGYILSPDLTKQWVSTGYADDSLTASITISFDETVSVDRLILKGINVKEMNIFYNGVTANAFTLSGPTTTSQFNANAATDLYLAANAVDVTSVTFDFKKTMTANTEKAISQILISKMELALSRIPSAQDYTPAIIPKELLHELSDGGTRSHTIETKWKTTLKFKYLTETLRDSLKDIYDQHVEKIFVPFGTATAWDGFAYAVNWVGHFEFYKFSDNANASGFTGSIDLRET